MRIRYDDLPLFARQQIIQDRRMKKIEERLAEEFEAKKKAAAALAEAPYYIRRATELNEIHKVKSMKLKDPPFLLPSDMLRQWNLTEGPANGCMEMAPTTEVPKETATTVPSKPAKGKKKTRSSREEGTGTGKKSKSKKRRQLDEPMEESGRKKKKSKSK